MEKAATLTAVNLFPGLPKDPNSRKDLKKPIDKDNPVTKARLIGRTVSLPWAYYPVKPGDPPIEKKKENFNNNSVKDAKRFIMDMATISAAPRIGLGLAAGFGAGGPPGAVAGAAVALTPEIIVALEHLHNTRRTFLNVSEEFDKQYKDWEESDPDTRLPFDKNKTWKDISRNDAIVNKERPFLDVIRPRPVDIKNVALAPVAAVGGAAVGLVTEFFGLLNENGKFAKWGKEVIDAGKSPIESSGITKAVNSVLDFGAKVTSIWSGTTINSITAGKEVAKKAEEKKDAKPPGK
jgi:hypothetical protein